ncbi:MAG TPA: peptide-methionine (R)-S-oxide reductase MsrB [Mesorhizobium sp.]|jgi:peptide-methionine (R)-S-oxide reductase|nr:peptide-methionine (R)-S-oxide reductase MsrB [Mesorhizobium sp.]
MLRREFLMGSAGLGAILGAGAFALRGAPATAAEGQFEIAKTEAEWRAVLSEEQYAVLREEATEHAFSSPLNDEKRKGAFHCAGCDLPLYASETKYDSGTGWPSFWESLPNAVSTKEDNSLFMARTEVHCRRCGGHLGHIFDDGPEPTGKRHCINGLALTFKPAANA